jgi:hypothetical protein
MTLKYERWADWTVEQLEKFRMDLVRESWEKPLIAGHLMAAARCVQRAIDERRTD